jgi:hypothetical protein
MDQFTENKVALEAPYAVVNGVISIVITESIVSVSNSIQSLMSQIFFWDGSCSALVQMKISF